MIHIGIECESIEHDLYGVARLVRKLLEQLAARPELVHTHRFTLYFNARIPGDEFMNSPVFEKKIVGLPRWGLPPSFSIYYYLLLPLRLWRDRVDLMYWPNYMLPIIAPRPSLVMLTEDVGREMHNPRLAWRYRIAYRIFTTWAAKTATRIMAISHASKDNLARIFGIVPERILVNELAVDPPHLVKGVVRTQPYLLFVGQAFERRHLRETLIAFEQLAPSHPNLQFVVVGPDKYDPPIIDALVTKINGQLGRQAIVQFAHATDKELVALYENAEVVAYVSALEGFGLPPLEALAYGVPAVIADSPVNREIYGECAFYTADESIPAIGAALNAALADTEHRRRIRNAAPSILARYTWSQHADRFLHITNEILHA